MSESVQILIKADDQASGKIKAVSQNLDGLSKTAKEVGGKTKASFEFAGTLANVFGGTAIGAFSSELAGLTERVSAFSEVSKSGAAGAFAFKAGVVAAAGAVTYKVAETIASWWFEIDKAKASADAATASFNAMAASLSKARQKEFATRREEVSLIRDPAEREKEINRQAKALEDQAAAMSARIKEREKRANNDPDTLASIERDKKLRDEFEAEAESLRDLTSERTKSIEARKKENAAADRSDAFIQGLRDEIQMLKATKEEQQSLEAARNATPQQRSAAEALIKERDALKAQAEERRKSEQEAEAALRREEDAKKRIAELEKKTLIDIESKRIEQERGREAARAYRLEQEGISAETAKQLAAAEEKNRQAEEQASARPVDAGPQAALQGRLLTQGIGQSPLDRVVAVGEKQAAKIDKMNTDLGKKLDDLYEAQKSKGIVLKTAIVP